MAKYKMVEVKEQVYEDLEGSLEEILDNIQMYIDKYGKDAYFYYEIEGWDDGYRTYYIRYQRQETDAERNKRLAKARKEREQRKAAKVKQEEEERKELARLLKKFGEG